MKFSEPRECSICGFRDQPMDKFLYNFGWKDWTCGDPKKCNERCYKDAGKSLPWDI